MTATLAPDAPVEEVNGRTLDWRPRYDERSRGYAVAAGVTKLPTSGRLWQHGPVLDQGAEGACVGFGCAGDAGAEPVVVPGVDDAYALALYRRAQHLDDWPGEGYSGTSVLAGCLAGRELGLWTGFRWAFSVEELAAGVVETGPAIIGVTWRQGMYDTDPRGVVQLAGPVVGGHCLLVVGFDPKHPATGGPAFTWLNSWGNDYGDAGLGVVPLDVMRELIAAGAELAFPEGRAQPSTTRKASPAAADDASDAAEDDTQPATAPAHTRTLEVSALEVEVGDRVAVGKSWTTVQDRQHLASGLLTIVQLETASKGLQRYGDQDRVRVRRPVEDGAAG